MERLAEGEMGEMGGGGLLGACMRGVCCAGTHGKTRFTLSPSVCRCRSLFVFVCKQCNVPIQMLEKERDFLAWICVDSVERSHGKDSELESGGI